MRLIDAPIGIFRFDGELVLKTEYYRKDKQSGKYIPDCYIIRTGEYFWGSAKTANELINLDIEPVDFAELLPTVTDTISRQAAIDAIDDISREVDDGDGFDYVKWREYFCELPSAQPKRGKWIEIINSRGVVVALRCSRCEKYPRHGVRSDFCPNCGADMRGEQDG